MKNQPGRSVSTLWRGGPEEESGSPTGFGASPRWPTGVEMMNSPHLRPSRLHQVDFTRARSRPARRGRCIAVRLLDARAARVPRGRGRPSDHFRGRPGAGPAPIAGTGDRTDWLIPRDLPGRSAASRPGRTSPAVTSTSSRRPGPAQSLGRAIPAIAALSVQSAGGGMNSSTPSSAGHRADPLAEPRFAATPPPTPSRFRPVRRAPGASWRPGRRRPPPGSSRPGRRSTSSSAGSRRTGHSGRGGRRGRPSSGRRS